MEVNINIILGRRPRIFTEGKDPFLTWNDAILPPWVVLKCLFFGKGAGGGGIPAAQAPAGVDLMERSPCRLYGYSRRSSVLDS